MVHGEMCHRIHLSEIHTLLIENTDVTLSSYLIAKLIEKKVKIIFCDESHQPNGEIIPYYGSHDCSKKIHIQKNWMAEMKEKVWINIVCDKIKNQKRILELIQNEKAKEFDNYLFDIQIGDKSNQEAHAARKYFPLLFGKNFTRDDVGDINSALNYGYTILLGMVNREVVKLGYNTQLGIHHCNYYNFFNLSCDLMEPFRPVVDYFVYQHQDIPFDTEYKHNILSLFNKKIEIDGREQYLNQAIHIYIRKIFKSLEMNDSKYMDSFTIL